jgi:hypothetical protein
MNRWKELADVFLVQYDHNIHSAPDLFDLQRMEKKSGESFHEYVQGWRERASMVRPPLEEKEMMKIFINTLKNLTLTTC